MNKLARTFKKVITRPVKVIGERLYGNLERLVLPATNTDSLEREQLENLDVKVLYTLLEEDISRSTDLATSIREGVIGQVALLSEISGAVQTIRSKPMNHLEANRIVKEHEEAFLKRLTDAGLRINYRSEVSPEQLAAKPSLILATHQGGGMENYIAQAITGIASGIVLKGELLKVPYLRDGLAGKGAIPVDRKKLINTKENPDNSKMEIDRVAKAVVEKLAAGENMLVFIEGTRSRNGEIASTPARKAWARDLLEAIDANWIALQEGFADIPETDAKPAEEFQKLLLVVHTKTTMPDAPEEDIFLTRFRLGAPIGARLVVADGLVVKDSEDPYDEGTLFGKARSALRQMLVDIIIDQRKTKVAK